jgi:hypothetical protein
LAPQQYAVPVVASPHVCSPKALRAENVTPPVTATGTGTALELVEPSPSWPALFDPQQYATPFVASPHVCSPEALRAENVTPPVTATGTGTALELVEPSPSWPALFAPQQYATPFVASPQVCAPAALSSENEIPPVTATGTELELVEPSPRWPELFNPQQYAAPSVLNPQVCTEPALKAKKVSPPVTAAGTTLDSVEPLPRAPDPQQYTAPAVVPPQVCAETTVPATVDRR